LWANFRKQWKNAEYNVLLWKCAKATTINEFNELMEHMKRICEPGWKHLNKLSPQSWCRGAFSPYPKSETLLNNACEQFNSAIVLYRSKPIITLAQEILMCLVRKMNRMRKLTASYTGQLCPKAQAKLDKAINESFKWTPTWAGDPDNFKFVVECRPKKLVVDLGAHSCTCNVWDITGIPCEHAIACMAHNNWSYLDYVHPYFHAETWRKTYEPYINPTTSQEFWEKTNLPPINPPPYKRPPGRPKKVRRKDPDESQHSCKIKRVYDKTTCSKCGGKGHNAMSCKGEPVNNPTEETTEIPQV